MLVVVAGASGSTACIPMYGNKRVSSRLSVMRWNAHSSERDLLSYACLCSPERPRQARPTSHPWYSCSGKQGDKYPGYYRESLDHQYARNTHLQFRRWTQIQIDRVSRDARNVIDASVFDAYDALQF